MVSAGDHAVKHFLAPHRTSDQPEVSSAAALTRSLTDCLSHLTPVLELSGDAGGSGPPPSAAPIAAAPPSSAPRLQPRALIG